MIPEKFQPHSNQEELCLAFEFGLRSFRAPSTEVLLCEDFEGAHGLAGVRWTNNQQVGHGAELGQDLPATPLQLPTNWTGLDWSFGCLLLIYPLF